MSTKSSTKKRSQKFEEKNIEKQGKPKVKSVEKAKQKGYSWAVIILAIVMAGMVAIELLQSLFK